MALYENWSFPELRKYSCPICGVEAKKGMSCGYHSQARRRHAREVSKYRAKKWTEMVCELVDEARGLDSSAERWRRES